MYDHYIGIDWAQQNMAIARMTKHSSKITSVDVKSDIKDLQAYLGSLKGKKIITIEESSPAQWLYTELKNFTDEIIVCDPYRNRLLKEGAKNDIADAERLVTLLKNNLLKAVYHCSDDFIHLRKLISGYDDLVKAGVRLKNQQSALFRSQGKEVGAELVGDYEKFVLNGIEKRLTLYESEKADYTKIFNKISRSNKLVKNLNSIPGIGLVGAISLASAVVDPTRFNKKSQFLAYSGLIKLDRISGGRLYGKVSPRYNRMVKKIFKTAAVVIIGRAAEENLLKKYYNYLINEKKYPIYQARHALAQRLAVLALGVMKSGKKYDEKLIKRKFDGLNI